MKIDGMGRRGVGWGKVLTQLSLLLIVLCTRTDRKQCQFLVSITPGSKSAEPNNYVLTHCNNPELGFGVLVACETKRGMKLEALLPLDE